MEGMALNPGTSVGISYVSAVDRADAWPCMICDWSLIVQPMLSTALTKRPQLLPAPALKPKIAALARRALDCHSARVSYPSGDKVAIKVQQNAQGRHLHTRIRDCSVSVPVVLHPVER